MKKINKILIMLILLIAFCILGFILTESIYYAETEENLSINLNSNYFNKMSKLLIQKNNLNQKLIIPSLKINAHIDEVGITKSGNMSTPNIFFNVGLYKYGPKPGEKGSSVIDGHVNNNLGFKAVFGDLKKITKGDDIYVELESGNKIHFIVTSISVYDFDAKVDLVFDQNDGYYLKLITCTGTWLPFYHTHDKRLVVTAEKE